MPDHGKRPRLTFGDLDVIDRALVALDQACAQHSYERRRIQAARTKVLAIAAAKQRLRRGRP